MALEVLLAQAVQVIQAEVDSLGVLLVSQVFNYGYTGRELKRIRWCVRQRYIMKRWFSDDWSRVGYGGHGAYDRRLVMVIVHDIIK